MTSIGHGLNRQGLTVSHGLNPYVRGGPRPGPDPWAGNLEGVLADGGAGEGVLADGGACQAVLWATGRCVGVLTLTAVERCGRLADGGAAEGVTVLVHPLEGSVVFGKEDN